MTTLEAALATDGPQRAVARLFLALANAAMAAIIGAWTLGPTAAVIGALAMLLLPYLSLLSRVIPELVLTNLIASAGALVIVAFIAGTIFWGIKFAFCVGLVLAPVMLITIAMLARANSLVD